MSDIQNFIYETITNFDNLNIDQDILKGLYLDLLILSKITLPLFSDISFSDEKPPIITATFFFI